MALRNAKMDRFKIRKVHGMWPQLFIQQSLNKCLLCRRHCTGYKNKIRQYFPALRECIRIEKRVVFLHRSLKVTYSKFCVIKFLLKRIDFQLV